LSPLPLAGKGWGGGSGRNGGGNSFEDAGSICHHVVIAEAKNEEALGFNRGGTFGIRSFSLIGKILAAIQLYD